MSEVDGVIVMLERHCPSQSVEVEVTLTLYGVLVVAYLSTISNPTFFVSLCLDFRVHEWLHSVIVETIWFQQVDDVKLIRFPGSSVAYPKIKPLGLPLDQKVRPKNQIVFILVDLNCSSQIGTFKPGFKLKCCIILTLKLVPKWKTLIIITALLRRQARDPSLLIIA